MDYARATPSTIPPLPASIANMISSQLLSQSKNSQSTGEDDLSPKDRTPTKSRSLSDSDNVSKPSKLSPSPNFRESVRKSSKDDNALPAGPRTPRRPDFLRGLSLQMPPRDPNSLGLNLNLNLPSPLYGPSSISLNPAPPVAAPLSPKLDRSQVYGSPTNANVLPRHSRGLDFSRACTNLHHSTLAESSPDSSPTITQKGMMIPPRRNMPSSMSLSESPGLGNGLWDKGGAASSLGSIMMEDDSSSSDEDLDPMDGEDGDDPMLLTPQVSRAINASATTPFAVSPGQWPTAFTQSGQSFLMSHRRSILRNKGRSRKSSSSASGHSSLASPGPRSPPLANGDSNSYFAREAVIRNTGSRRESLSLGTMDLHISSGNDSGDEANPKEPTTPARVVRRPVARRGDMLVSLENKYQTSTESWLTIIEQPRARAFSRIKAQLAEESAPVDSDMRKEAEVIRQVWESDPASSSSKVELGSVTAESSPALLPTLPGVTESIDPLDENPISLDNVQYMEGKGLLGAFGRRNYRTSGEFWNPSEMRTPPPPLFPRAGSSAISDDIYMDSPSTGHSSTNAHSTGQRTSNDERALTPQAPPAPVLRANKRVRDDELEYTSIKRRAVSPGVSVTNSPVLSQSPAQREGHWGQKNGSISNQGHSNGQVQGERSNSGGSVASMTPNFGPKRVGLQAMGDTNEGLMKMSIE